MSEAKKNDILGDFFGGIGGKHSNILIILVLFLLFSGGKGFHGFWGKFDENLILVLVVVFLLFGGNFRF